MSIQAYFTFTLFVFLLLPIATFSVPKRLLILVTLFVASMVPLPSGISLAGYLRGLTDDLAITTMVWLALAALCKAGLKQSFARVTAVQLWLMFAVLGLMLYPAAMGIGMLDTYRWGFSPRPLIAVVGLLALLMLWLGNRVAVAMLGMATLAFIIGIKPSGNYWDYLIDPFLFIYATGALIGKVLVSSYRVSRNFQSDYSPSTKLADSKAAGPQA